MLTVIGYKGYRMVRATHGVSSGSWYFEMQDRATARFYWQCSLLTRDARHQTRIVVPAAQVHAPQNGEDGHVRLGWCTEMGDVQVSVTAVPAVVLCRHLRRFAIDCPNRT